MARLPHYSVQTVCCVFFIGACVVGGAFIRVDKHIKLRTPDKPFRYQITTPARTWQGTDVDRSPGSFFSFRDDATGHQFWIYGPATIEHLP